MHKFTKLICFNLLSMLLLIPAGYANKNSQIKLPIDDLQRFTTVLENIKNYYVNPIEDKVLFNNAIRGMLLGLDPHSAYLDSDEFAELKVSTTGKFGGIGIEVSSEDGFIRVITPIDDTPAKKAGVQAGDLIIRLNDTPIRGMPIREAVDLMRGKPGTTLDLTILRKNQVKPIKITVARDLINVQSVRHEIFSNKYGYLRISQFQSDTGEEVLRQLRAIKNVLGNQFKGLILDLRNNPGGIFEASVATANAVLNKQKLKYDGLIVYTKGRLAQPEIKEYAKGKDMLDNLPIVVLINGGSASASEIVAGALQDHNRALILGTRSFGKGSVQTLIELKNNRGLKLTTALYYTPAGRSIQATGITPDILVEDIDITVEQKENDLTNLKESDLQGHLSKPRESNENIDAANNRVVTGKNQIINRDYQLNSAIMILDAMQHLSKN